MIADIQTQDLGDPADRAVADYRSRRVPQAGGRTIDGSPNANIDLGFDEIGWPGTTPPSGGGTPGPAATYPFDVTLTGSGTLTASVKAGTINGLIPSNFLSTFSIGALATGYLVLSVTTSGGQVTGALLSLPSTPPVGIPVNMGQPPTTFDYLLGAVVNGVWFRVIGLGSLAAASVEAFRVSKVAPAPGTLPYDIYYTWNITAV